MPMLNGRRDPLAEHHAHHVGATAKEVAERASAITRLELELAQLELKRKVAALGLGTGLVAGAAVFGLYAVGFGLAAAAAGLATALDLWLALLIVAGAVLLVAGVLGAIGASRLRSATPPVPTRAIEEAKRTTDALRS